ncbi:hypothetical protein COHA_003125 [Chlorella ohadii]|uniref:Guanylate cyclase domain-containing protein n=1 Tax=Chlorella ohadii TaxID=2649997 RepID=A0AAD5DVJ5_9CHLO|nr:hypothetical protein COHA_003125 [Chlorella ohadii]
MMRKLSNALGQEGRPGTGSRVHPADGAAAAAPQDAPVPDAALSAAADGAAAQQGGSPPGLREQYSPAGEGLQSIAADAAAAAATPEVSSGSITAQMQRKKSTLRISFADPTVSGASSPPKVPLVVDASAGGSPNPQSGSGTPAPRKAGRTSMLAAQAIRPTDHGDDEFGDGPLDSDRKGSVFDLLERRHAVPQARWRKRLTRMLQSGPLLGASLLLTILILYAGSFRLAVAPKSTDPLFLAFSIFVMVFFSLEAGLTCLANPRYAKTFYFWVDVIATLSILIDIPAIMDPIINGANDGNGDQQQRTGMENAAQITAASTRAARLAQVTKWMRLWNIIRLWCFYWKHRDHIIDRRTFMEVELEAEGQSRVGKKLTELTIRKIIIMVLLVMFAMPVFDVSVGYYGGAPMLEEGGLQMLHDAYGAQGSVAGTAGLGFNASVQTYVANTPYRLGRTWTGHLLQLWIYGQSFNDFVPLPGDTDGLRDSEYANYTAKSCNAAGEDCRVSYATFDIKWESQIQGWLGIGRTTFIIVILLLGAVIFIRDTERLVLRPLERMVQLVREVSENPLAKVAKTASVAVESKDGKKAPKAMETQVLEQSIHKICSLLSVGFGEAGAEVIADNIKSGGDLNPMVPGRKVAAIFGFCDIRSFTDATEVLQEDVMEFVNSIAQIVHSEVALHGGAANKNIGDAFLLDSLRRASVANSRTSSVLARTRSQGSGMSSSGARSSAGLSVSSRSGRGESERMSALILEDGKRQEVANVADQALASFIIIQSALKRSQKLKKFSARPDLNARMPGYQVNMGFGLHVGWAIEGAIGSEYKIDASYLSPHVNMASRLEAATKQFGSTILLSEDFVRMLSPGVRAMVRQVDCVTVKGSKKPVGLFTYDVDVEGLANLRLSMQPVRVSNSHTATPDTEVADGSVAVTIGGGGNGKAGEGKEEKAAEDDGHETFSSREYADEYAEHPDIVMTRAVDAGFLDKFAQGYEAYRTGDWPAARAVFEKTVAMRRNRCGDPVSDGPSATLLRVMAEHNYQAPADWAGYRELTEK